MGQKAFEVAIKALLADPGVDALYLHLYMDDPGLHGRAGFVSLSFDPINDSHASLQAYGGRHARAGGPLPWHFLTTRSVDALRPILEGFGQEIEVERDARGRPTRTISHMLKLFLIDRQGRIREIYSTAYLHPETMFNDIRTLAMEEDARRLRRARIPCQA